MNFAVLPLYLFSMALTFMACSTSNSPRNPPAPQVRAQDAARSSLGLVKDLIVTPSLNGHEAFLKPIQEKETHLIRMSMFHLTDPQIIQALIEAAERSDTQVRVLLDRKSIEQDSRQRQIFETLSKSKVQVKKSSSAFSIAHAKSMVINEQLAFITAINLTQNAATTRDFGVTTTNAEIIGEMIRVFDSDWNSSEAIAVINPVISDSHLLWSPVNSQSKLTRLISKAQNKSDLIATVENLGDPAIEQSFKDAVARGAHVRLILPECDKNKNPVYNYPYLKELSAAGVEVRVMPYPATPVTPYMHSKMIVVDSQQAYVGSVNFSVNSTSRARELGVIFDDQEPIHQIRQIFETDWSHSKAPQDPPPTFCPVI